MHTAALALAALAANIIHAVDPGVFLIGGGLYAVKQTPLDLPSRPEKMPLPDEQAALASTLLSLLRKAGRPLPPAALMDEFEGSRPRARRWCCARSRW